MSVDLVVNLVVALCALGLFGDAVWKRRGRELTAGRVLVVTALCAAMAFHAGLVLWVLCGLTALIYVEKCPQSGLLIDDPARVQAYDRMKAAVDGAVGALFVLVELLAALVVLAGVFSQIRQLLEG